MARRHIRAATGIALATWVAVAVFMPRPVNPPMDVRRALGGRVVLPADIHATLTRSCYDCHSDETRWPWYSNVFPVSLLLRRDVSDARGQMNLSHWENYSVFERADLLDEMCRRITTRDMPLPSYLRLHPDAVLSDAQIDRMCAWTRAEVERLLGGVE